MNNKLIIFNNTNSATSKLLAEHLDCKRISKLEDLNPEFDGIILNFANWKQDVVSRCPNARVFNKPEQIKLCSDKHKSLRLLADSGIPVPRFTEYFPCVARTKNHRGGSGFWLCLNQDDFDIAVQNGADYSIEYIPVKNEYRVHVFFSDVLDIKQKFINPEEMDKLDLIIRSFNRGWIFKNPKNKLPAEILTKCTLAVDKLGLVFGAVDVIESQNGEFYILEVNSSAGLNPNCSTLNKFVEKVEKELLEVIDEPPVDNTLFTPMVDEADEFVERTRMYYADPEEEIETDTKEKIKDVVEFLRTCLIKEFFNGAEPKNKKLHIFFDGEDMRIDLK